MLSRQQRWRSEALIAVFGIAMFLGTAFNAAAQEVEKGSFLANIAKGVVLDPTTYAPSIIAYDATMRDWNTSQTFFQHGYLEHNPRFTISGRANDVAVGYGEGQRRIVLDAVTNLQISLVNNLTSRIIERSLLERYPEHRKLVRAVGWVERIAFASYLSYMLSEAHYRQWKSNQQLATQMGF